MNNVMLDPLPDSWNGYRMDTDFRIGLQVSLMMYDSELSEYERLIGAIEILYIDIPEDMDLALEGLSWFLNGWNHDNFSGEDNVRCVDFDIDQWRIYSAFLNQYRIKLDEEDMHWWTFMGLLSSLGECAYTQVVSTRLEKIDPKLPLARKEAIKKSKRIYAIQTGDAIEVMSPEEKVRYEEFMKFAKIKKASPEPGNMP